MAAATDCAIPVEENNFIVRSPRTSAIFLFFPLYCLRRRADFISLLLNTQELGGC
jgi:hypothetical protein